MIDFAPQTPAQLGNPWELTRPPCNVGGGDGGAAREAEASRLAAKKQHEENMQIMRKQARQAANVSAVQYAPAAAPQAASQDALDAGLDFKRKQKKRFGSAATMIAPQSNLLGGATTLGG